MKTFIILATIAATYVQISGTLKDIHTPHTEAKVIVVPSTPTVKAQPTLPVLTEKEKLEAKATKAVDAMRQNSESVYPTYVTKISKAESRLNQLSVEAAIKVTECEETCEPEFTVEMSELGEQIVTLTQEYRQVQENTEADCKRLWDSIMSGKNASPVLATKAYAAPNCTHDDCD